jgi:hypothetical protein
MECIAPQFKFAQSAPEASIEHGAPLVRGATKKSTSRPHYLESQANQPRQRRLILPHCVPTRLSRAVGLAEVGKRPVMNISHHVLRHIVSVISASIVPTVEAPSQQQAMVIGHLKRIVNNIPRLIPLKQRPDK